MNTDKLQSAVSMLTGALILGIGFFIGAIARLDVINFNTLEWGKLLLTIVALLISALGVNALYSIASGQREQSDKHQAQQLETQKKLFKHEMVWKEFKVLKDNKLNSLIPKISNVIPSNYQGYETFKELLDSSLDITKAIHENYILLDNFQNSFSDFVNQDIYTSTLKANIILNETFFKLIRKDNEGYFSGEEEEYEMADLFSEFESNHGKFMKILNQLLIEIEESIMKLE